MLNRLLYLLLRTAALVAPRLPVRALYAVAEIAGMLAYLLLPTVRKRIVLNFSRAFPEADRTEIRRRARGAFRNDAKNWIDSLRIPSIPDAELNRLVRVEGWDRLEHALAGRRGAVIVTMHLGNFDLVGQLLAARGFRLTVPVERMHPPALFEFLTRMRASRGIRLVPVEQAPRAMLRALSRGELVGITVDRPVTGRTIEAPFFGRPTRVAHGVASLIRLTEAPVVMGVGVRVPGDRFQGYISAPFAMDHGPGPGVERANTRLVLAEMERFITRVPEQWLAFWNVWPDDADPEPGRVGQRSEAAV